MMKKHNLKALLCMDPTNVRYVTSTATPPWMIRVPGWRYCLLVEGRTPVLWEHGDIRYTTKEQCSWLDKVNYGIVWMRGQPGPQSEHIAKLWAEGIKKELKEQGVGNEPIGLDAPEILSTKALKDVGIQWVDGQSAMIDARVIKTKDELECLKIAAAICDTILDRVKHAIRPGVREVELVGLGYKVGYDFGMDDIIGFTVCSGPYGWPNFKYYTDRMIRPGDAVTYDIGGASFNGYKTCYYRTFCCGQPSQKLKDYYQQSLDYINSAIRKVKPGATTADLVKEWPDATKEWGYESEWEAIANEWGHGLGLSLYEPPTVSRAFSLDYPFTLKENMAFALETQQGSMKEKIGVRVEEMLIVTSSGCEIISKYPVDEITVCPL